VKDHEDEAHRIHPSSIDRRGISTGREGNGRRAPVVGPLNSAHTAQSAQTLVAAELDQARTIGQPHAIGVALRSCGLLSPDREEGIALLSQAVDELARSPSELELARAQTELGAALRRGNHRADARGPLREGLELAHRCGASALAERAHRELLATGARPRRLVRSGLDALTPSGRRVAEMAAAEKTNREIAQALFVTTNTVATHLSHAYQKLDLDSRAQLQNALANETGDKEQAL
jgi:DNA-binding CsgD family transcriptional regulator